MMNIILFGPPGIGKSTIIGILKTRGIGAIDLEDLYPNRVRFQIPNLVEGKVLGAADLSPARSYSRALKVLLSAQQDVYDARRAARDSDQVEKQNQRRHLISDWMSAKYDLVLDTTKLNANQTASAIESFLKGGHEKHV